jgi:hypothetical protein
MSVFYIRRKLLRAAIIQCQFCSIFTMPGAYLGRDLRHDNRSDCVFQRVIGSFQFFHHTHRDGQFIGRSIRQLRKSAPGLRQSQHAHQSAFYEVFEPGRARSLVRRIEFHYTPKHGSWLNIAENELSSMTRQCVQGRRIGNIETHREETSAWASDVNDTQHGVDWQLKIDDVRVKLTSVYPKIKL